MLDRVTATTVEVAGATVKTTGFADVLGDIDQVDTFGRVACSSGFFNIGPGRVVADQAVNVVGIGEVEAGVCPAVAGVTAGAARFVAGNRGAEIVNGVLLATDNFIAVNHLLLGPGPVSGLHKVIGMLLMALQTLCRHFRASIKWALEKIRVIVFDSQCRGCS